MALSTKDARWLYASEMRDRINMSHSKRKPGLDFYDSTPTGGYVQSFDNYFRGHDTQGYTDEDFLREFGRFSRGEVPGC